MTGADTVEQLPGGGWQVGHRISDTVERYAGHNVALARTVYGWLGAVPPTQFYSIGFSGADNACRIFFLTADVRRQSAAFVLDHEAGLRLSRAMLWSVYAAVFTSGAASEIVVHARRDDHARRATLQRLGFRYAGVEVDTPSDVILYGLRPADLPLLYRRAVQRRSN